MHLDSSWYFCLCGNTSTDRKSKLPSTLGPSNIHSLGDLYFCPTCQNIKCIHCCLASIECKYCVNCMTDYSDSLGVVRCTKNCFECPCCGCPLNVSVEDAVTDTSKGKRFTFKCVSCTYIYKTQVINKPAALSTIVKNENPTIFTKLHERYTLLQKLQTLEDKSALPQKVPQNIISRMKAMDIRQPESYFDEIDRLSEKMAQPPVVEIIAGNDKSRNESPLIPLGKQLVAKRKYSCEACRTPLVVPVADHRLMKILIKQFASDIVPRISAKAAQKDVRNFTPGSDTACTLNIVNAMSSSVNVTVSILSQLPPQFMGNNAELAVSFPFTHFSVQGRRDKLSMIDSVPSPYLTNNTKTSRAEQLTRASRREAQKRESPEGFIEVGANWVSVPFSVSNTSEASLRADPTIPFYITIESKLPDAWKPQSGRRGLKYGFWVACQIEP